MNEKPDADLLRRIQDVVGPSGYIADKKDLEPYLTEWRGLFHGSTPMVVLPNKPSEVAAVVRLCAEAGVGIVPQGGNTGLCGGAIPDSAGHEIVLCLARLNRIRAIDTIDNTVTAEAGCILADIQNAATDADRLFPLSLAAEGSCQIGGNLSTDAGGVNVLRYGTARDQVLGLEVVLADGRVWDGLRGLRKDTAGYDLKQLFIGAEGTLGVITAAVCKLYPRPKGVATALIALPSPERALDVLGAARDGGIEGLAVFELLPRFGLEFVLRHIPGTSEPFSQSYPWYSLIEVDSARSEIAASNDLERLLATGLSAGSILDGVVASSGAQRDALWRLRESMSEAQKREGASIKHDVAVPLARIPEFLSAASETVLEGLPDARIVAFGHLGDGNIHFNVSQPEGSDPAVFVGEWRRVNRIVHDVVVSYGGTVSAEHGIGQLKLGELERYRGGVELSLMRAVKRMLDPQNIMNPGKLVRVID